MDKMEVARILEEISLLLELKGENPFKARAYENGARIIEMLEEDLETLVKEKRLSDIRGIGKALEEKIEELVTTGTLKYYEDLKKSFPQSLFELLKVPGLGPKKVKVLYGKLGITTLEELEYSCMENRLISLPGFGNKTQENILKGIAHLKHYQGRYLFSEAWDVGKVILERLKEHPKVLQASLGGSLRRRKELIKDVDLLAASEEPEEVMEFFTSMTEVKDIVAKGDTKSSVRLSMGMAVDLRIVSPRQYPYALHHFTGSKEHNTAMRHLAKELGIKMNEYGLFQGKDEKLIYCESEEEIFNALGMEYIPPELRENTGEIEAAIEGRLPHLLEERDITGIFHVHSHYSDGANSIVELAEEARRLGYKYIGISDHSRSAFYAHGLGEGDILRQHREIDEINKTYANESFRIFKGIESDILPDGSLDYPEEILSNFDFVVASVHSMFSMDKESMTKRILKALDNPYVTILGHPTGRLLLSREEYPLDMEAIIHKAVERGIIIEINSNPHRLDLDWRWCKRVKELAGKVVICPDAHDLKGFADVFYGVGIARKGWMEKKDVINCMDLKEIETFLNK